MLCSKNSQKIALNETGKIKRFNKNSNETSGFLRRKYLIGNIQPEKFINF